MATKSRSNSPSRSATRQMIKNARLSLQIFGRQLIIVVAGLLLLVPAMLALGLSGAQVGLILRFGILVVVLLLAATISRTTRAKEAGFRWLSWREGMFSGLVSAALILAVVLGLGAMIRWIDGS